LKTPLVIGVSAQENVWSVNLQGGKMETPSIESNNASRTNTKSMNPRIDALVPSKEKLSTGLGWVSLALGLGEVAMTRTLARAAGLDTRYSTLLRAFGLREMASGLGLLATDKQEVFMWSRVVGDALDGAFLGYAFSREKSSSERTKIALAATAIAPIVILDIFNALRASPKK
jgi:hypothetical protein